MASRLKYAVILAASIFALALYPFGAANAQDKAALPDYVFSDVIRTRVLRHAHGDSSGVRGAAMLWPAEAS